MPSCLLLLFAVASLISIYKLIQIWIQSKQDKKENEEWKETLFQEMVAEEIKAREAAREQVLADLQRARYRQLAKNREKIRQIRKEHKR